MFRSILRHYLQHPNAHCTMFSYNALSADGVGRGTGSPSESLVKAASSDRTTSSDDERADACEGVVCLVLCIVCCVLCVVCVTLFVLRINVFLRKDTL